MIFKKKSRHLQADNIEAVREESIPEGKISLELWKRDKNLCGLLVFVRMWAQMVRPKI